MKPQEKAAVIALVRVSPHWGRSARLPNFQSGAVKTPVDLATHRRERHRA